jgi:hypothetical protein
MSLRIAAVALLGLLLAGCSTPTALYFAARDVGSDDLYVGTFRANQGEPVSVVSLFGVGSDSECRGTTGAGGVRAVTTGTPARLTMRCSDGRILRGELVYDRADRGSGLAKDTRDGAVYQVLFGPLDLDETSLRREFAALPPPVDLTPLPPSETTTAAPDAPVAEVRRAPAPCRSQPVNGQCLDDFDFGDFNSDDVEEFLRQPDEPGLNT